MGVRPILLVLVVSTAGAAYGAPAGKPTVVAKTPVRAKPAYAGVVKAWHTPAEGVTAPLDASGRPKLVLGTLGGNNRVDFEAAGERGGFSAFDLDRAASVLRDPGSGNQFPVEPRLLDVVYRIQAHFHAQELRIMSGYRTPRSRTSSNHGKGRALDFVVPGAADEAVAKFARELGYVGVGVYPTSGFVHVDVRERSYFWTDSSGPGKRNRERGILAELANKSDALAAARGERASATFAIGWDVDAARILVAKSAAPGQPPPDDEDEDL